MEETGLRESHWINSQKTRTSTDVTVGDVVVLKSNSTKRAFWKLEIVEELIAGRDGKIRAAGASRK